MKIKRYYVINVIVLAIAAFFLGSIVLPVRGYLFGWERFFLFLVMAVVLTGMVYCIKAVRLYLIVMETRIGFKRFLKLYIKTTFVNITLPLKMGELFRCYCYGNELNNYKLGILCVLVDRYFDSIPLVLLLLGLIMVTNSSVVSVAVVIMLFILLLTIIFIIFPSGFIYLNKFCIINVESRNGIKLLKVLDNLNVWYHYIRSMIKGRGTILLVLSAMAWFLEYAVIFFLTLYVGQQFSLNDFIVYMSSVFSGGDNLYMNLYVAISGVIFVILSGIIYGYTLLKRGN